MNTIANKTAAKAKQVSKSVSKTVANNKTPIAIGVGIVAVGAIAYFIYKSRSNTPTRITEDVEQPPATISDAEAIRIAEGLFSAMDMPGTDESEILDLLTGLTYNDFQKVYKKFGLKYYDTILGTQGGSFFNDKYDLISWLSFELSDEDFEQVKLLLPDVFHN